MQIARNSKLSKRVWMLTSSKLCSKIHRSLKSLLNLRKIMEPMIILLSPPSKRLMLQIRWTLCWMKDTVCTILSNLWDILQLRDTVLHAVKSITKWEDARKQLATRSTGVVLHSMKMNLWQATLLTPVTTRKLLKTSSFTRLTRSWGSYSKTLSSMLGLSGIKSWKTRLLVVTFQRNLRGIRRNKSSWSCKRSKKRG